MLLIFLGEYRQAIDKIVEAQLRRGMKYQPKKKHQKLILLIMAEIFYNDALPTYIYIVCDLILEGDLLLSFFLRIDEVT